MLNVKRNFAKGSWRNLAKKQLKKKNQKGERKKDFLVWRLKGKNKEREREREEKKKAELKSAVVTLPPYKSANTLGKAVKRAESALPKSPRKRATVVKKTFNENK